MADDVVAGAGAAGVQQDHGIRDRLALQFDGRRLEVAALCAESFVHVGRDQFGRGRGGGGDLRVGRGGGGPGEQVKDVDAVAARRGLRSRSGSMPHCRTGGG